MTFFQIGAVLFALFMMYVVSIHGKKRALSVSEVSFWISCWIFFIIIALFPNLLIGISHTLRFARIFDLLLVAALMVLTVMVFLSYFSQKELHKKMERLTREMALRDHHSKKPKL
jgi:hypothetical protein